MKHWLLDETHFYVREEQKKTKTKKKKLRKFINHFTCSDHLSGHCVATIDLSGRGGEKRGESSASVSLVQGCIA